MTSAVSKAKDNPIAPSGEEQCAASPIRIQPLLCQLSTIKVSDWTETNDLKSLIFSMSSSSSGKAFMNSSFNGSMPLLFMVFHWSFLIVKPICTQSEE
ncbi:hypothetical protein D3C76_1548600 [compost metagenome]